MSDTNIPYWEDSAFHERLQTVPFRQEDADGVTVVNVNCHFYKLQGGKLFWARVPENLTIPTEWDEASDTSAPMAAKALSMLGGV